ncbi:MAG: mechanosensitive ion channel family protein [Microthrixaceae bacterium]
MALALAPSGLLAAGTPSFCVDGGSLCEPVWDATGNEVLARAAGWLSDEALRILGIVVVAVVAAWILRVLIGRAGRSMIRGAEKVGGYVPDRLVPGERSGRAEARAVTLTHIATSISVAVVAVVALTAVLSALGVSLAALLASAGVLGVALGFGAQNLVRDVLAGWFILVEDRYGVGDIIDAGAPVTGTVERITLRSTRLRDISGTVWHIANGEMVRVGNKSQSWSRAVVDVVVTPDADVDRACSLLGEVGDALRSEPEWATRITGAPDVLGVHLIDATGVTLRVVCDTEPAGQFPVEREYRKRVLAAFESAGIPLASVAAMPLPPAP